MAEELGDARAVAYCLFSLQRTLQRLGRHEEAHRLLVRELHLFREVGDPVGIAVTLDSFGALALRKGDLPAARAFLEEALTAAEMLHISYNLGQVALEEGALPEARGHFARYLRRAHAIDFKEGIVQGLGGFARVAAYAGQHTRAIRLAAAADALREVTGAPLAPYWREDLDRRLRLVAEAISGPEYDAAWEEGQRMTLADAIANALDT